MNKSEFLIKKMDCPSEESMIRMKLAEIKEIEQLVLILPSKMDCFKYFRNNTDSY